MREGLGLLMDAISGLSRLRHALNNLGFWQRRIVAVVIGVAGGNCFNLLGFPGPWLSGAMTFTAVAALCGLRADVPLALRRALFVILGASMGAGITPSTLNAIATWPITMAGLLITVSAISVVVYAYLRVICRWDKDSAFFASIPGALSYVIAVADNSKADIARVALSQTIRVFLLVALLPGIIVSVEGAPMGTTLVEAPLLQLALLCVAALAGAAIAPILKLPAGELLGAFVASSALHASGLVTGTLPLPLLYGAFILMGVFTGLRFAGTDLKSLRDIAVSGLGAFAVAMAVALAGATTVAMLSGFPFGAVMVAYAPGGLDAMISVAFALHLDPAFVAAHQLARFLPITFLVPVLAARVLGREWNQISR